MINTNLIETRREKLKITKYRMADLLGMSRQSYYSILTNKSTTLNTLEKIANILGLKPKDLIL
jgi:transcriptional regulator with XRE-family HTH domain